jgi:hypothetical protein
MEGERSAESACHESQGACRILVDQKIPAGFSGEAALQDNLGACRI